MLLNGSDTNTQQTRAGVRMITYTRPHHHTYFVKECTHFCEGRLFVSLCIEAACNGRCFQGFEGGVGDSFYGDHRCLVFQDIGDKLLYKKKAGGGAGEKSIEWKGGGGEREGVNVRG